MRGIAARSALALSSAALLTLGVAGCNQSDSDQSNLKIVEQVQIDKDGKEVKAEAGAAAADPRGDGKATCDPLNLAMAGALTGQDSALGINIKNGVQLAVDQHNKANPGCQVTLKTFDTEGVPQKATQIAPQIVNDEFTVGLIGPAFSGETKATGQVFDQAGLVAATASATNPTLSEQNWRTFFRGLANDAVQGPSVANYLKNLGYKKICVVDDSSDYGVGLAETVNSTLGEAADQSCKVQIKKGEKDFSAAVNQLKGANPDAVFFAGYYTEAALLVKQLRDGGYTGPFASADGAKDPEFVKQAGDAAKDAVLACPCGPAGADFTKAYTDAFQDEPGTYSTEGYDLATILLKGIDSGKRTRADLLEFVRTYEGQGLARKYQWTPTGELTTNLIWIYKVQ